MRVRFFFASLLSITSAVVADPVAVFDDGPARSDRPRSAPCSWGILDDPAAEGEPAGDDALDVGVGERDSLLISIASVEKEEREEAGQVVAWELSTVSTHTRVHSLSARVLLGVYHTTLRLSQMKRQTHRAGVHALDDHFNPNRWSRRHPPCLSLSVMTTATKGGYPTIPICGLRSPERA